MGDKMILNEKELETCLEFALNPILDEYNVIIKESHLSVQDSIHLKAVIIYQDHVFDVNASFMIGYKHQRFYFYNIEGKVEYLFLQLSLINVLKQILNDENIAFKENQCSYQYVLPIKQLYIQDKNVCVELE